MFDFKPVSAPPPSSSRESDARRQFLNMVCDLMCDTAPDEDKPIMEVLRNYSKIEDLARKLLDMVESDLDDKPTAIKRANRVNAVFEPVIAMLEQLLTKYAKGDI